MVVVQSLTGVQLLQPNGLQPARLLCPRKFPGKNTGMGYHFLLQGIFPTQGLNSGLLLCRWSPALQENSLLTKPAGKHSI